MEWRVRSSGERIDSHDGLLWKTKRELQPDSLGSWDPLKGARAGLAEWLKCICLSPEP
jgi:hypothetical protein